MGGVWLSISTGIDSGRVCVVGVCAYVDVHPFRNSMIALNRVMNLMEHGWLLVLMAETTRLVS